LYRLAKSAEEAPGGVKFPVRELMSRRPRMQKAKMAVGSGDFHDIWETSNTLQRDTLGYAEPVYCGKLNWVLHSFMGYELFASKYPKSCLIATFCGIKARLSKMR
jgi:hypothetical protein